jgi:hypothetical protein
MPDPVVPLAQTAPPVLQDVDYARQSSEKQIFEDAQKPAPSVTSQEVHVATSPQKPEPVAIVEPAKPASDSQASSVYLGPQAGEVCLPK